MEPVDTLICARWVLPVEPGAHVLDDHAVAIRDGRIVAVLPQTEAVRRYATTETLQRPTHVLMPGLVNAHTHAPMTLLRGRAENARLGPWLRATIRPLESRWVDPAFVRDGVELAIAEMLRGGTTCFADMYYWPDVIARAAAELHVRASVGLVVTDVASAWAGSADEYIDKGLNLHDEYRGDPLISTHLAPYSANAVSDATLSRVRRLADQLELGVATHLHESRWEIERSVERHGKRPLARLHDAGLVNQLLIAVHFTQAEPDDIDALARACAAVVHCPESNLKLGSGICPLSELVGRGIRVALGSDGAASNNDLDLLGEARTAGLLASGGAAGPGTILASDLLRMATLDGARTLGLGEITGSLLAGKWADLCCIDLHAPRSWPVHDVATTLVYSASAQQVTDTWVAGRRLLADGTLLYIDETAVMQRAEDWRARLAPAPGSVS